MTTQHDDVRTQSLDTSVARRDRFPSLPRHISRILDEGSSFTPEQMYELWNAIQHYGESGSGEDYIDSAGQLVRGVNHVDPVTGLWAPTTQRADSDALGGTVAEAAGK